MALTDTKIRNAKPEAAAYRLTDTGGLYLQISPSGGKLWRWNYRHNGKQKTIPYGKYPEVTLAMARERHAAARIELAKGNDPMAQRKAEKVAAKVQAELEKARDAHSFEAVALQWHKWWAAGVGSKTAAYIRRRLEADVFPVIGRTHINEIKPADIRNLILAIERGEGEGRRFEGQGARDVAQRQHGTISQIYRFAIAHELADGNPAAAFRPGDILSPRKTRNRARIESHQIPALLVAMENYDGHAVVKSALKLMALTFVRTQELLRAPWSEFDLENGLWKIDARRMKKDRPHIVPLSRQAVTILRELKQIAGEKHFVFPGLSSQTIDGTINCNSLLGALAEIGFKGIMTGHGYRGLASTILADNGFDKAHIEVQLAHADENKTAAAYNHARYLAQRTALMQWWADYLDAERKKGKREVVTIRKTA